MKRLMILIMVLAATAMAHGQQGLHVNAVFEGRVVPQERMVETRVRGKTLSKYRLSYYHSVRFQGTDAETETVLALVERDKEQGVSTSETTVPLSPKRSYTLKMQLPSVGQTHRFLCYQERRGDKKAHEVTLVYMEGTLTSLDQLNELINKR